MWGTIQLRSPGNEFNNVKVNNTARAEPQRGCATSSIMGPSASLSMTPCPVDDTSDFCTSSMLAAAAFSVTNVSVS